MTPAEISAAYDKRFKRGWRRVVSDALHIRPATITDQKPGMAFEAMEVALEFMDACPVSKWPARWIELKTYRK